MKYQPLYSRVTDMPDGVTLHFAQLTVNAAPDHKAATAVRLEKRCAV